MGQQEAVEVGVLLWATTRSMGRQRVQSLPLGTGFDVAALTQACSQ